MRFYGLDAQGIFQIQSVSTLPAWTSDDERRWVYAEDTKMCHYGTDIGWATFSSSGEVVTSLAGYVHRPVFEYKDIDEIYVGAGVYNLQGTIDQTVYWDSQLTIQLSGASTYTWYYLYINENAVIISGTNVLTASEFLFSTTEPSKVESKHGWYNGNNRCIFAVLIDGSNRIEEFFHNGNYVEYNQQITDLDAVDIDDAWADVTLTIPNLDDIMALVTFESEGTVSSGTIDIFYRKNGSTAVGNLVLIIGSAGGNFQTNSRSVVADSSQIIEVKMGQASNATMSLHTDGWFLPVGM